MNTPFIHCLIPVGLAIVALLFALRLLYFSSKAMEAYEAAAKERVNLLFATKLAAGIITLSTVYTLGKVYSITMGHYNSFPNGYLILDAMQDVLLWVFLSVICYHAKDSVIAKIQFNEVDRRRRIIEYMVRSADGFMWIKDNDGYYLFCDPTFCSLFFGLDKDTCEICGFTDMELIADYRASGKEHTFGELCISTDQHCKEQGVPCRYIECGKIDGKQIVLDIRKTPLYDKNGSYEGVVGFATDRGSECRGLFAVLQLALDQNKAVILSPGVYWIKDEDTCQDVPLPVEKKLETTGERV